MPSGGDVVEEVRNESRTWFLGNMERVRVHVWPAGGLGRDIKQRNSVQCFRVHVSGLCLLGRKKMAALALTWIEQAGSLNYVLSSLVQYLQSTKSRARGLLSCLPCPITNIWPGIIQYAVWWPGQRSSVTGQDEWAVHLYCRRSFNVD